MQVFAHHDGATIHEAVLTSDEGVEVSVLSHGAIVRDWRVPDRTGRPRSVTLGFDTFAPYAQNARSFGVIAGRLANRVREGRFTLDGTTYQLERNKGPDHIHGGSGGIGRRNWTMQTDGRRALLTLTSPDGEMGYPGTVRFTAEIALDGHTVTFAMRGEPDRPTPIALSQHSYYRLAAPAGAHVLEVRAANMTELGPRKIPTGRIMPVADTVFDFRVPQPAGATELDINYCLDEKRPAATLATDAYRLALSTDRPGLQVYNGYDFETFDIPGHDGIVYGPFPGIALEAGDYPDAVNHPNFPGVIATPERPYRQLTSVTITPQG